MYLCKTSQRMKIEFEHEYLRELYEEGNLQDIEAVYVNMQYRLEFRSRLAGTEHDVITICSLLELSNHYKK